MFCSRLQQPPTISVLEKNKMTLRNEKLTETNIAGIKVKIQHLKLNSRSHGYMTLYLTTCISKAQVFVQADHQSLTQVNN